MSDRRHRLDGIELLQGLDPERLKALECAVSWHDYAKGEEILARNSPSRDVFFVAEGCVRVVNFSAGGREIAYTLLEAGSYFGELAAIDGKPRSTHVVAVTPCVLAALAPERFEALLREHDEIALRVLRKLAGIIRSTDERIMDLSTRGTHQRLYAELLRLAREDPALRGRWLIHPLPTQQDLAARVSTTRETVARVIGALVADGLAEKKGRTLYLKDRARLDDLASRDQP